jgi:hypothetical protein
LDDRLLSTVQIKITLSMSRISFLLLGALLFSATSSAAQFSAEELPVSGVSLFSPEQDQHRDAVLKEAVRGFWTSDR